MIHHHESEQTAVADASNNSHCESCGKDLSFAAYIIGASALVGAVLIAASLFYNFKLVLKQMDQSGANLAANTQIANNQQPAAPSPTAPSAPAALGSAVKITLKPNTPYLGSSNAKVTVVEYADYQCPFCEKWYTDVMSELKTKYISTGKIKFIFQDFAFLGADSNTAAEATHCATDQNKFWQYHDYLFTHQGQEGSGWATADHQKEFAKALGLNKEQFNQCLDSGKYKQEVLDETAAGKSYGVSGTPSVFVNGQIIVGAQPATIFVQAIDAALKK